MEDNDAENDDDFSDNQENNTEDSNDAEDMTTKMQDSGVEYLEINYTFQFDEPYNAKIETEEDGTISAKFDDDDEEDVHLEGEEAFNKIYENISSIEHLDSEMDDQEVVERVSGSFDTWTFITGKVKVIYEDGTEIDSELSRD